MMRRSYMLGLVVLWSASSAPAADKPEKLYQELFGAEARTVAGTASTIDDVAFAKKLLDSAKTLTEAPDVQAYLWGKAYEFAVKSPKGYAWARDALERLEQSPSAEEQNVPLKRLELLRLQYRAARGGQKRAIGDELISQCLAVGDIKAAAGKWVEAASLYQQAVSTATYLRSSLKPDAQAKHLRATKMQNAERMERRVRAEPDKVSLRMALIRYYLVELDDPELAARHIEAGVSEVYRIYVPLAAKSPRTLAAQPCLELGDWYKSLALSAATTQTKTPLAVRAHTYYSLYLRKARAEGVSGTELLKARLKIAASLKELGLENLPKASRFADPSVQKAYDRAIAHLWSRQSKNGSWLSPTYPGTTTGYAVSYHVAQTAVVLYGLLEAGAKVGDIRVGKALKYLEQFTSQTEGIAYRALVWHAAQKQRPGIFIRGLQSDTTVLLRGTNTGGYYTSVSTSYSGYNYSSWQPLMGMDAGLDMKLTAPKKYWTLCLSYWTDQQHSDGGWSYYPSRESTSSSYRANTLWTAVGTASVAVCLKSLYGKQALKLMSGSNFAPLRRGLAWLDKKAASGIHSSSLSYTGSVCDRYYQLSRVGLLTQRKTFGRLDWAESGSRWLAKNQGANGSWSGSSYRSGGSTTQTAQGLMFLANCLKASRFAGSSLPTGGTVIAPPSPAATSDPIKKAALKRIELLAKRLAANPTSTTIADELVRLYAVELQDPASAQQYADKTGKADTAKLLALAAKSRDDLVDAECLDLGNWYSGLAEATGSTIGGRKYALGQARICYQNFLKLHKKGDAKRLKAKLALQKVNKALAQYD